MTCSSLHRQARTGRMDDCSETLTAPVLDSVQSWPVEAARPTGDSQPADAK